MDILGVPIEDYSHCSKFIAGMCAESRKLLLGLVDVTAVHLQVAVAVHVWQLLHIARFSLALKTLTVLDKDVKH